MTTEKWLATARSNSDSLLSIISSYHPRLNRHSKSLTITAPAAESVRQTVVKSLLGNGECQSDPVKRFEVAIATGNVGELLSIFHRTWFGVPESTSCWHIRGFSELVDLLDDPPEQEEEISRLPSHEAGKD